MNHKEALQEIVSICSDNESSIDLVHRIEMLAEKALMTEAVVVSAALDKQWRVEWDEAPDDPPAPIPFRQPNRHDLMSTAEKEITTALYTIEGLHGDEKLTNAMLKLMQARDLVYEYYRCQNDNK